MCGILAAVAAPGAAAPDRARFETAVDVLAHRGPDGRAVATPGGSGRVLLGHRRLAIQDPTPAGAQPMSTPDSRWWLTYNGEVYDHPTLRRGLERQGVTYRSDCDTETVLHAWATRGRAALEHLDGIFAFVVWDELEQRLVAVRDRLGVKPLYWADTPRGLVLGSEPAALVATGIVTPGLDRGALVDYLTHGVAPFDRSCFAGVHRLPPGHVLVAEPGAPPTVEPWWELPRRTRVSDPVEAAELVADEVERAVGAQLLSDRPVSTWLSGGLDSSVVTAVAQRHTGGTMHSITIGFEEDVSDERRYARAVVEHCGTTHHEAVLHRDEALRLLWELPERYDEPYGMNAAIPMLFVAELTRDAGFPVVLSGDGADELFGGYLHHDLLAERYRRWGLAGADVVEQWWRYAPVRALKGRFDPLQHYRPHDGVVEQGTQLAVLDPTFVAEHGTASAWRLARSFDRSAGPIEAGRVLDLGTYLPDEILTKVDRATMAHGVEARVPLLDHRLVELAFAIDPALHRRGGSRKAVLKDAARLRGWLPESVLTDRKKGFSLRIDEWLLAGGVAEQLADELVGGALVDLGVLRGDGLAAALTAARRNEVFQLWVAERWARRWL